MKRPIVALCYDFDGTLAPGNMQERDFIPKLKMRNQSFWEEVARCEKRNRADLILAYMYTMLEKARSSNEVKVTKEAFSAYGAGLKFFPGVEEWFKHINDFAGEHGVDIKHFIISSGLREMIEGSKISKYFERVYASSFIYNQHNVAVWPAHAVNFTTKTQYLFRINKGILDELDETQLNEFQPPEKRWVPFARMIYIGDGQTDVPCMRLVKNQGGVSIGVYKPKAKKEVVENLYQDGRINFYASADYRAGKDLEQIVTRAIIKMAADYRLGQFKP